MVFLFTLALAFTVAIAYLSRLYFEEPFLRMKRRFDVHGTQRIAALESSE
jgi:peptidoglycan/LPS O-acetylase OafA/YrhL